MKTIQILSIVSVLVFLTGINAYSQDMASIDIKTSSQCEMCKDKLESGIGIEPGVKEVNLNLDTKVLTVKYNNKKTTPEKLRLAVSKLGYDADDVKADPEAYQKLPACCKKPCSKTCGGHH